MNKIVTITSGKGGVGKSQISANFAFILSQNGYKTALLEVSDLPNLDIIMNEKNSLNLADFILEKCEFEDIFSEIRPNLFFISSDGSEFAEFSNEELVKELFVNFKEESNFDFIIIDAGSGISQSVLNCIKFSDKNIIVTIPEPAAISDAYAMIKSVNKFKNDFLFVVNMVKSEEEAVLVFENLKKVALNNIKIPLNLNLLGFIKKSQIVPLCAKERVLFCEKFEYSGASFELQSSVSRLLTKSGLKTLDIKSSKGILGFIRKLTNLV